MYPKDFAFTGSTGNVALAIEFPSVPSVKIIAEEEVIPTRTFIQFPEVTIFKLTEAPFDRVIRLLLVAGNVIVPLANGSSFPAKGTLTLYCNDVGFCTELLPTFTTRLGVDVADNLNIGVNSLSTALNKASVLILEVANISGRVSLHINCLLSIGMDMKTTPN